MILNSPKYYFALIFLVLFPLYMLGTFDHSLWNPDETRDAGIARSMFVDRDFVVPRLNGEAFLEKPPLYYWSASLVYAVTGRVTAGLTRLPAALYGFLGVFFTFLIGRRFFGDRVGFMAAVILGTGAQYFRLSHMAIMDTSLTALITGAFYFYLTGTGFLFLIFTLLAFYAKGFVAVALIGLVMATDLLLQKQVKRLLILTGCGAVLFGLLVGPWVAGLWKSGGIPYLKVFFIDNNFMRFASKNADHTENSFFMYFLSFPADFLPWSFFALPAMFRFYFKRKFLEFPLPLRFICLWFLVIFVFLTLSTSKRSIYLLPAFPAAALLSALWFEEMIQSHPRTQRIFTSVFGTVTLSLILADVFFIKKLDREKTFVPIVDVVKSQLHEGVVAGYDLSEMERGVFTFYLERNIPNLKYPEALASFIDSNLGKRVILLLNKNHLEDIAPTVKGRLNIVYKYRPDQNQRSYVVLTTP